MATHKKRVNKKAKKKVEAIFKISKIIWPVLEKKEKYLESKLKKIYEEKEAYTWHEHF